MNVKEMAARELSVDHSHSRCGVAEPVENNISPFKNATRLQESITAAPERKALLWLAARMPARINS
ncbi:MAG: hypothetical protein ACRD2U_10955, partial [Terriglobales bacterium]